MSVSGFGRLVVAGLMLTASLAVSAAETASAGPRYITIGTGSVTGVYYPAGGAICRLVNKDRKSHGVRCSVESTAGSGYNLQALREAELDMAIAQSDVQYHAYNGTDKFASVGPDKSLRSVFSLYSETFTVVVRKDSGIKSFDDLKGKRVNIGEQGSGQRAIMDLLMQRMGWTKADFLLLSELPSTDLPKALCDNKLDAGLFTAGHPNGLVKEALALCDNTIVEVRNTVTADLIKEYPYYVGAIVPGGIYNGLDHDVLTFGTNATFITSTRVPDDTVYLVTKAVFESFDNFKQLHPAFENLRREDMVMKSLTTPLHPGAERYYREVGLIK